MNNDTLAGIFSFLLPIAIIVGLIYLMKYDSDKRNPRLMDCNPVNDVIEKCIFENHVCYRDLRIGQLSCINEDPK